MTDAVKGIHVSRGVRAKAIMARPRSKTYRPVYSFEAIGASRASGLVVMPLRRLSKRPGAQVWGQIPGQLGEQWRRSPAVRPVGVVFHNKTRLPMRGDLGMIKGHARRTAHHAMCVLAAAATLGLTGCTLLTPSRPDLPPRQLHAQVSEPAIGASGVLRVAIDASDAPQSMIDGQGKMVGYAVDVAHALGDRLGLRVEFVTDVRPDKVGSPRTADIYIGAREDDEDDAVTVVAPYLESAPALFAKTMAGKASPLSSSVDDLEGATVGVQSSSAAQDMLSSLGTSAEQKTYANVNECLSALDKGEVDFVACDATAGAYLSRAYGDIVFAGALDESDSYGIAVKARNEELREAIVDALDEIEADGTLDAIHTAWYGTMPVGIGESLVAGLSARPSKLPAPDSGADDDAPVDDEGEDAGALSISGNLNALSE